MKKQETIKIEVSKETKKGIEEMANDYGMTMTEFLMMCYNSQVWNMQADEQQPSMTLERAKKLTADI